MKSNKSNKITIISISLKKELLEQIDNVRGLVPRSTYIVKILKDNLK